MLFVVSYRKKHASSKTRKTFFAEHNEQPSVEQIQALVNSVSGGNFAQGTIALQKCPGFDTDELIKTGITVFHFETEPSSVDPAPVVKHQPLDPKYDER